MTSGTPQIWPTTPLQQGLVALAELARPESVEGEPDHAAGVPADYLGQSVVELSGPVDLAGLRAAIADVVAEQPHLHAGFLMSQDVAPVQFVDDDLAPVIDVHGPGNTECDDVEDVLAWQRGLSWEVDEPPLVRWDVVVTEGAVTALVIAAHHAVLDGWSMPLLVAQVARHYARLVGVPSDLPAARGRYGDHLTWLAAQDAAAARQFWADHLAGLEQAAPAWLRPREHARRPAGFTLAVDPVDTAVLAERGLTPAALARTCWGLALDAVAGTSGTPFAVAVSTRDAAVADADDLIGLTTDAVLVAERPDPHTDVLTEAVRAQRRWADTLPHHHVGLRGIHAALRSGERAHSLLAVESDQETTTFVAGPVTFALASVQDDTHYPLAATLRVDAGDGAAPWQVELTYDANRVQALAARRHAAAFAAFVEAARNGTRIGVVDVLGAHDRELLAHAQSRPAPPPGDGNATEARSNTPEGSRHQDPPLLAEAFAATCTRFGQRVALVDAGPAGRGAEWTFAQLAADVTALRDELLTLLPAHGNRSPVVAITRPRSARTAIALLAVLDAGAAALVLDPALPAARREATLTQVDAALVVTADGIEIRHREPRGARRRPALAQELAGIVLTSGSTGQPKPVAVPHRALAHLLAHHSRELHPDATEAPRQVAHTAAFHFDAHWDALLAMFAGHTVHVLADDLFLDPYALADYADAERIDYLDLTPTVWSALLAADAFTRLPRLCVLGGEALPADLWNRLRDRTDGSDTTALNLYGPSEATVDAAWASVSDHPTPVVGRPLGETGVLVLDGLLRRVPPGTPGELYLTGPQLADGYLNQAGLTAERFVANPYPRRDRSGAIREGDERMYRTGDLAHWTDGGLLVLGGRTDGQLSLAGRRVEPGEIEAVLTGDDRVREAVVTSRDSVSGRGRVVGYVIAQRDEVHDRAHLAGELLDTCRDALPPALVPADIVVLDAWPLTPNGKLDRAALPAPQATPRHPGQDGAPPAAATISTDAVGGGAAALEDVRACLRDVLQLPPEQVGADADFFALGGDSITAIQLCTRLRGRGWSVRAGEVLSARTTSAIAALAQPVPRADDAGLVDAAGDTAADDPFGLLTPARRVDLESTLGQTVPQARLERVLPLSPTQLGIYIDAHRLHPDPYRTTITLRLDTPAGTSGPDVDAAVTNWFAQHESLRVAVWQGDLPQPIAVVLDRLDVPHRHIDATHLDEDGIDALLERVRRDELDRDMSFGAARLAGYTWVRRAATTSYLIVSMHHLLADGWSTPVLARELQAALAGTPEQTPDTVFADYLRWWQGQDRSVAELVWQREFEGAPSPTLVGRGSGSPGSRARRVATSELTDESAALTAALRREGVTAAAACQAAWSTVLADLTGRDDVTYLLASSGRPEHLDGIESAVGMFVTTRPVRVTVSQPIGQLAHAVSDSLSRTETASHLGLGRISQLVGAVADTLVVVENYPRNDRNDRSEPDGAAQAAGAAPRVSLVQGTDATTFPVTATVSVGDHLRLEVEVDPAQCDADPRALAQAWRAALGAFCGQRFATAGSDALDVADAPAAAPILRPHLAPVDVSAATGAARNEAEVAAVRGGSDDGRDETIAAVMADVLRVPSLPADASFFDAGGDSILAVRLVGALRTQGLRVGIADVFAAATPRALAAHAVAEAPAAVAPGQADMRLTPALSWYRDVLRRGGSGRGFQQLRAITVPADTAITAIGAAAQRLLERHDALRLRVGLDVADIVPVAKARPALVSVVAADTLMGELRRLGEEIDPVAGDLVRWAVVSGRDAVHVYVLAHHIAVDAVSWGILTDELHTLVAGGQLPPAPSFAAWTRTQAADGVLTGAAPAAPTWMRTLADAVPLVTAASASELGLVGAAREIEVRLDAADTAALLEAVRRGWRMETLLLAALTADRADDLVVELEGHGRPTAAAPGDPRADDPGAGAVGWFTATWPLRLPGLRAPDTGDAAPADPGSAAQDGQLRRHLARTAQADGTARLHGPDYGLLRHLHPELAEMLAAAERRCPPQVLINYLGSAATPGDTDPAALESDIGLHADLPVSHAVEINAHLEGIAHGGASQLVARWQVAAPIADHAEALIQQWTGALRAIASLDLAPAPAVIHDAIGLTPMQVQALRDDVPPTGGDVVQAVWPPTPVQRGMIFHAALQDDQQRGATGSSDPYTSMLDVGLTGPLDPDVLRRAIESVLAEQPQLRLRVRWINDETPTAATGETPSATRPILVTVASTDVAWRVLDLRGGPGPAHGSQTEAAEAATEIAAQELTRSFDLERDPLLRVTLVRTDAEEHRVVITNHHVLLDGWSMPLLLDAVLDRYADLGAAAPPQSAGRNDPVPVAQSPFARHVARSTAAQVGAQAALERRATLLSGSQAGPVTSAVPGDAIDQGSLVTTHTAIHAAARRHGTTESAVVATAWGAVLAALTDADDAVCGTVVSGRDPDADTDLIGMFTDTVPVLARFGAQRTIADAVSDLGGQIAASLVEPTVGLARLGSMLGRGQLFDALLVIENYPAGDTEARAAAAGLRVSHLDGGDATHYPLSLTVELGPDVSELRLEHDRVAVPGEVAAAALEAVVHVLDRLADADVTAPAATLTRAAADLTPRLPDRAGSSDKAPTGVVDPDETVRDIVSMYRDLFAVTAEGHVDADANFFALGGDSILAMSLVTACRSHGLQVRAGDVFAAPTPRGLAALATPLPGRDRPRSDGGTDTPAPAQPPSTTSATAAPPQPLISLDGRGAAALDDLLRSL